MVGKGGGRWCVGVAGGGGGGGGVAEAMHGKWDPWGKRED